MTQSSVRRILCLLLAALPLLLPARHAAATEIAVAQYGSSTAAWPFAVALYGGFFKKEGVDISDIRSSGAGTDALRAMLAGGLPFVTSPLPAVLSAAKAGADIKIISDEVHTSATFKWIVLKSSPINSIKDLKGKKITFTTPQSTSQMLDLLLLDKAGIPAKEVTLLAAGTYGGALTLLDNGGVDVVAISQPTYAQVGGKYKVIADAADVFQPLNSDVAITSGKAAKENPDMIRKIVKAHGEAVDFMMTHRQESSVMIDKVFQIGPDMVLNVMNDILDHGNTQGVPYWGHGEFVPAGFDNLLNGLHLIGAISNDVPPWRSLVDQSFLPKNLQRPLN